MGKYVGKIFRVNNNKLGIQKAGSHFVHVKWFNPFNNKFYCKVITSLETNKKLVTKEEKSKNLKGKLGFKNNGDNFSIIGRKDVLKIKKGDVTPIPNGNLVNFDNWSGYFKNVILSKTHLESDSESSSMKIKNIPHVKYIDYNMRKKNKKRKT